VSDDVAVGRFARRRLEVALALGAAAAFVVSWFVPWQLTVLVGWDVTAICILTRFVYLAATYGPEATRVHAAREDASRPASEFLLLTASIVSLAGVALAFVEAGDSETAIDVILKVAGVATIALSWAVVHSVYALRYAHLFYRAPVGGVDFKGTEGGPDYRDFAYVAYTIGMTYQVADTDITSRKVRPTVLRHAMLSFLFGSVILATTVNVLAGVLNG
jgi:uncharacterized membrane protein